MIRNNGVKNEKKHRRKKRKELILKSKLNAINLEAGGIDSNVKLNSNSCLTQLNRRASSSDLTTINGKTNDFMKTAVSVRNKRISGSLHYSQSLIVNNKNNKTIETSETKSKTIKTFLKKIF